MADKLVAQELKAYLIAQVVGVHPPDKGATRVVVPTIWLQPRDGPPQPRWCDSYSDYQEDTTITLVAQDIAAPNPELEAYVEEAFIDVIVRSRQDAAAQLVHRVIRGLIAPVGSPWGRQQWTMNTLTVQYSTTWRTERQAGATPVDYRRDASYRFGCTRRALAGLAP